MNPGRRGKHKTPGPEQPQAEPAVLGTIDITVRWRDLDAFQHVNNATFLTYIEEARLQWLQSLPGPWVSDATAPVMAASQLNYRRPIEWPETLRIELFSQRLGNTSVTLGHRIVSARDPAILYSDGHSVLVWIDRRSNKPAAIPAVVRTACGDAPAA